MKSFKDFLEEMMTTQSTTNKPGLSSTADAAGPLAGLDPVLGGMHRRKRKENDIKSNWISYLTRTSYKKKLG